MNEYLKDGVVVGHMPKNKLYFAFMRDIKMQHCWKISLPNMPNWICLVNLKYHVHVLRTFNAAPR